MYITETKAIIPCISFQMFYLKTQWTFIIMLYIVRQEFIGTSKLKESW